MGNSVCKSRKKALEKEFSVKELENSVLIGDIERLKKDFFSLKKIGINLEKKIITYGTKLVSPLVFAFLIGNFKSFVYFIEECDQFKNFHSELQELKIDPFYYLCKKGFTELLLFSLPRLNQFCVFEESIHRSQTLSLDESNEKNQKNKKTPVQKACENGHVAVVVALHNYYKAESFIPFIFDIEKPNESHGETCALIACRQGNLPLIRVLHKICKVDFTKLNSCNENALIICLSGYKKMKSQEFFDCFNYLVDVVQIDLSYKCEELLLLAEGLFVGIIESKLRDLGIEVTKVELENGYKFHVIICQKDGGQGKELDHVLLVEKGVYSRESTIVVEPGLDNFMSFVSDLKEVLE